jgi:glycosyltransferase involved in cell wall biosynthesis
MRIAHTEASLGWGGQEIRILSESKGLIGRGHEVVLLCPPEARIYAEAPAWKVPVVGVPIAKKSLSGVRSLISWFKGNRCDVLSTHSSTDSWLSAFALLLMGRPFPMVRTRHISAPVPRNPFSRWLYTRASAHIVTTGELLKKELVERNGYPAERIESVPTGIDPRRFRPGDRGEARRRLGLPPDATIVGIVATLRSWKGHLFLIDAVAELPGTVSLVIVGDGPMRQVLEARVRERQLSERTRFAGNQADVAPWLQAFDVFVLPSYANEGVPQALIQAMLTALPCVTTHAGSISELAKDGETALVVPPQQVAPLRDAIQRLVTDNDLSRRLGEAARRHCEGGFSYEAMLDKMERIYKNLLP